MITRNTLYNRDYYIKKYNLEVETNNGIMYIEAGWSTTKYCYQIKKEITSCLYIKFHENTWEMKTSEFTPTRKILYLTVYRKIISSLGEEFVPEMYHNGPELEYNIYPSHNSDIYPEIAKFCEEFFEQEYPEYFI